MDNQNTAKRYRIELSSVKDLLFHFLLLWTAILLVLSWLDFILPGFALPETMVTSYLILLGVYIIHKETSRWIGTKLNIRPGELMVYIWWISLLVMSVTGSFADLAVSPQIRFLSYEVLAAFLLSEISKSLNAYQREKTVKK